MEDIVAGEGRIVYDIRFNAFIPNCKSSIKILLNIEAQKKYHPGYDIVTRGIYYGARMISSQHGKEFKDSNYDDIKKVYSIWICANSPDYAKNTITGYNIQQEKVFGDFQGAPRYDILNVIFICLGDPNDKEIPDFLAMLSSTLNDRIPSKEKKNILQNKFNIPMAHELAKEVDEMCNLADAIEERGIKKGISQNARNFFINGASFELVRSSIDIEILSNEELQEIYDEVQASKKAQAND